MGTPTIAAILALGILQPPQETTIGDYTMPQLTMWQKRPVENYKYSQMVSYDRTVDDIPLTLKFKLIRRPKELKPDTANDLQKNEAFRKKLFEGMRKELPGFKVDTLISRITSFRGHPAMFNHLRFFNENKPSSEAKTLSFSTIKYDYILSVASGRVPVTPKAETAMDDGLKTMIDGLKSEQTSPSGHSRKKLRTSPIQHESHR